MTTPLELCVFPCLRETFIAWRAHLLPQFQQNSFQSIGRTPARERPKALHCSCSLIHTAQVYATGEAYTWRLLRVIRPAGHLQIGNAVFVGTPRWTENSASPVCESDVVALLQAITYVGVAQSLFPLLKPFNVSTHA